MATTGQVFIGSKVESQPTVFGASATFQAGIATGSTTGGQPPSVTAPSFPATTVAVTNNTGVDVIAYLTTAGVTATAIKINGTTVYGSAMTPGASLYLPAGATFSMTYSVGTPTWVWLAV